MRNQFVMIKNNSEGNQSDPTQPSNEKVFPGNGLYCVRVPSQGWTREEKEREGERERER